MSEMRFRWRSVRASLFPKLVLTFVAVMLPLFALSLVLNELARKEVKTQISDATREHLRYEARSLEQELERIIMSQQQIINDGDLLDLGGQVNIMNDYQRTEAINQLSAKLNVLKDSSPLIRKVDVYLPSIERVISTVGVLKDDTAVEEMEQIAQAIYTGGFPITEWKGRLFLSLVFPNARSFEGSPPLFAHQIELSADALRRRLSQISEAGGAVMYTGFWRVASDEQSGLSDHMIAARTAGAETGASEAGVTVDGQRYMAFYEPSAALEFVLAAYIPENILLGKLQSYRIWFWLLVSCSLVIVVVFSYGIYLLIQRPLSSLVRQFRNVEEGNFNVASKPERHDEFGYLFSQFERTVRNLKQLIDELYVQKIRLQQSELKQLQAQISPHFLYNSFFILNQLIKSYDNEKAEQISRNLGTYFQFITRSGTEEVTLESEVNHARSYMEIQQIRFSNRIAASFGELPADCRDVLVPRLILQPIIENAFEHGVGESLREGKLRVSFLRETDKITIRVEDDGADMPPSLLAELRGRLNRGDEAGENTGMVNVHRRLRLKYGQRGGIALAAGESRGLVVDLHIPLEEGNRDV